MELFKPGNNTYFDVRPKPNVRLKPSDSSFYLNLSLEWTLTFEHPYDVEGRWKQIVGDSVILIESPFHLSKQAFVVDRIQKGLYSMSVECHHYFEECVNEQVIDRRAVDATPQQAMNKLFEGTEFNGEAEAGFVTLGTAYFVEGNILNFINGDDKDNTLANRWGGEFFYNNRTLQWYERLNKDKVFRVTFSKNLTDIGLEEDWKSIYTRIYPKAYNGRKLPEPYYINSERIEDYSRVKSTWVTYDKIGLKEDYENYNEDNPPEGMTLYDTELQLEMAIRREVDALFETGIDLPKISGTLNAAILHNSIDYEGTIQLPSLGYTVRAYNKLTDMEYQSRIVGIDWNTVKKCYNSIELGDPGDTSYFNQISSSMGNVDSIYKDVEEIKKSTYTDWNQVIQDTRDELTEYINNGTYYGHVKITPNELLILDDSDIDKAVKVWRWNMGGLGFSLNGYAGPYETAITAGGKMVINEATAETIKATMIKAGVLASMDESSWFNLDDGSFSWADGGITFNKEDGLKITINGKSLEEMMEDIQYRIVTTAEHITVVLDEDGTPSKNYEYDVTIQVYKGFTTEEIPCVIKSVTTSDENVYASFSNTTNTFKVKAKTSREFTADTGYIDLVIETQYKDLDKRITWGAIVNTIEVSKLDVIPSSQVFYKEKNGDVYTPDEITLKAYPQDCEILNWYYSLDGGKSFIRITGDDEDKAIIGLSTIGKATLGENQNRALIGKAIVGTALVGKGYGEHGLTVTQDSLIISRDCDLYTDSIQSVVFKCVGTQDTSDIVTVIKIKEGDDAFNVILDNENHTFVGNYEGYAVDSTIDISLVGFKGPVQIPITIGNIYQLPEGMTYEVVDNGTITPILKITVSSDTFNTKLGTLIIPVTGHYTEVTDIYVEKVFSYSIACDGTPAASVKINIPSTTFLSVDGGSTFSPATITMNGVFFECSYSKWQYWDSTVSVYKDIISGSNGFTINSNNSLTLTQASPLFTDKSGTITLRLLSDKGLVFDTVTINKLCQLDDLDEQIENIKSQITQTNSNWKAEFFTSNSANMLYDGDFKLDYDNWFWTPTEGKTMSATTVKAYPLYEDVQSLNFVAGDEIGGVQYKLDLELRPNTDYVFQAYIYGNNSNMDVNQYRPLLFWLWTGTTPENKSTDYCTIVDYQQIVEAGRYDLCYVHFKTADIKEVIYWRGFIVGYAPTGDDTSVNVRQVGLYQGSLPKPWQPNSNEVKAGITTIDINGITVEHTSLNTKTKMDASGFYIVDSEGETIAELSSKEHWTQLKADKVFAGNIENVYEGESTLYVDHSATIAGDGTADLPFNSFAQLKQHLEAAPVINKDIYIIVRDPGFEINEQLWLERLKGTGYIKITLEGQLVIRSGGNGIPCILLTQMPEKWVWIVGCRKFGSSTTGAVLCDNPDEGGGGHGIFAMDINRLEVDNITIAVKNWGIRCQRTWLYTFHCDFGKCYTAISLVYQSKYYSSDDVGSCTNWVILEGGSFAYWGCGSVRPQGNVQQANGIFYDAGSNLTATSSTRYVTANPSVPTTAQYYTYTYGWTSHMTYAYSWSNWSDSDCKQGSWGAGLRGGHMFFDLTTLRSNMNGTVLDGNTITLTRANSGGLSGDSNVYINGSTCSSASGTPSYGNQTLLGTLKWGETKTFTLPKAIVQGLVSGTYNSLAVYVNSSAQNCYINIVDCSITLKVQK